MILYRNADFPKLNCTMLHLRNVFLSSVTTSEHDAWALWYLFKGQGFFSTACGQTQAVFWMDEVVRKVTSQETKHHNATLSVLSNSNTQ